MSLLHLALLQMDVVAGEPDHNFTKLEQMLQQAIQVERKPDVIVFPELWNTGFSLTDIHALADPEGERTRSFIAEFCARHSVNVVAGSIANLVNGEVRNTLYAFDRSGQLTAEYDKIHLFRLMDEEKYLTGGDRLGRFEIDGVPTGAVICYDIRFPELSRRLALDGAKLLFVPAQWPHPRLNHWRTLLTARAIENQMVVVSCNRVGQSGDTSFFGHSMVIDPWGEILVEGGEEEAILTAAVDLAEVDRVRAKIPVFKDRRPNLY
ncbi:carbon-nitrogen family hydrolase [Paenibacillus sp. J2TS4]|uniref:carbon-nitrogen family hydrolase n=1 Tax=Paenibacillus sp. J2TS4 TaxID=2807194 RepID=UPI001B0B1F20|nr:carbon-nitrogen family hydrolase [Paenibacillus sp. J2TS4]GIP32444.1 hydrolase [Paenibacillus sp. J2TS4]